MRDSIEYIDGTMVGDPIKVYELAANVRFSDLTDDEKEAVYMSAKYLEDKYRKENEHLRKELAKEKRRKIRVFATAVRKSK